MDANTFQINVGLAADGSSLDNALANAGIEIRVYP